MTIKVCVGSSCHLKGSSDIIALLQEGVETHQLAERVTLMGSFCIGKCNRQGVTVQVDEEIHVGVTKEGFNAFFNEKVLAVLEKERKNQ